MPERVKVGGSLFRPVVPDGAVYVGRRGPALAASKFASPFGLRRLLTRDHPLRAYLDAALSEACRGGPPGLLDLRKPLYDACAAGTPAVAVGAYRLYLADRPGLIAAARAELAGRDLACWCDPPEPGHPDICHGAVLLAAAGTLDAATTPTGEL